MDAAFSFHNKRRMHIDVLREIRVLGAETRPNPRQGVRHLLSSLPMQNGEHATPCSGDSLRRFQGARFIVFGAHRPLDALRTLEASARSASSVCKA